MYLPVVKYFLLLDLCGLFPCDVNTESLATTNKNDTIDNSLIIQLPYAYVTISSAITCITNFEALDSVYEVDFNM
jgi:hypothetical protein